MYIFNFSKQSIFFIIPRLIIYDHMFAHSYMISNIPVYQKYFMHNCMISTIPI